MEVLANIIHNPDYPNRKKVLLQELEVQGIKDYKLWDSIHDERSVQAGINRAHKQIVRDAKHRGLKQVLIFEDDIKFCGVGAFDYYISKMPDDYDLYLGGIFLGQIVNGVAERFTALHCYFVHERFYDCFLGAPDDEHLDGALAGLGKYVVCEPFIAIQHNGYSQNSRGYCNFDIFFENRKLFGN